MCVRFGGFTVASPGFCVRGHDDRGAESASVEAPSGCGMGRGVAAAIAFSVISGHRTLLVARKLQIPLLKAVVIVTTTFKSGGDNSPSSHTKLRLWAVVYILERKYLLFPLLLLAQFSMTKFMSIFARMPSTYRSHLFHLSDIQWVARYY